MARVKFDIQTAKDNTIYGIEMTGFPKEKVRYTHKTDDGTKSYELDWKDRYNDKMIKAVCGDAEVSLAFAKTVGGGGFAASGRAEEDHRRDHAAGKHFAENAVFSEQMGLTGDVVKGFGTHAVGERL